MRDSMGSKEHPDLLSPRREKACDDPGLLAGARSAAEARNRAEGGGRLAKKQQGSVKGSQSAETCRCGGELIVTRVVGQGMLKICQKCGKSA